MYEHASYLITTEDGNILINTGVPGTYAKQLKLSPDVWVSAHARHFNLHGIYNPGDPYDPSRFKGYREAVLALQRQFQERLQKERQEQAKPSAGK